MGAMNAFLLLLAGFAETGWQTKSIRSEIAPEFSREKECLVHRWYLGSKVVDHFQCMFRIVVLAR